MSTQARGRLTMLSAGRAAAGLRTRSRPLLYAALWAGAAAISGFTILRGVDPFDEGLVLQAARRVADGQVPYRDFLWPYGPAHPLLLAGSFKAFGVSLLGWRILRVALDAAVAATVFALVRREASARWALAAWLAAACVMAQPVSANPFPAALLLSLAALAVVTSERPPARAAPGAAALTALAALWRLDFAAYALAGALATFMLRPGPAGERRRAAAVYAGLTAGATLVLYVPFAVAAGPGELYRSLIGNSLRESEYWTLPFPLTYDGELRAWPPRALLEDGKDVLGYYVPLLLVIGLALAGGSMAGGLRRRWRGAGFLVFGLGCLGYLLSRTDEFHVAPLLVVLAIVVPGLVAGRETAVARAVRPALVAALGLLLLYGAANRLSALLLPRDYEPVRAAAADGVRAPPAEARALSRVVQLVSSRVPAGEPVYAVTRRSDLVRFNNPLLYVLVERDNPTPQDFGLQTSARAQAAIVRSLRRARPRAVIRWTAPISAQREPNRRGIPSGSRLLDQYLADEYRLLARAGDYEVLVPRPAR